MHSLNSWESEHKKIENGDSSCNKMEVISNSQIQDDGRLPYWILLFSTNSSNSRQSNTEEN